MTTERTPLVVAWEVIDVRDAQEDASGLLAEFASMVPHPNPAGLFVTDLPAPTIVRRAMGHSPFRQTRSIAQTSFSDWSRQYGSFWETK